MENYTLGLALFDYLPVIAAGFGLYLICKYCAGLADYDGYWIVLIPLVALTGGALKASWKLVWVVQRTNYEWMSDQLFFFLASAYVLMAALVVRSLRAAAQGKSLPPRWYLLPLQVIVVMLAGAFYLKTTTDGRTWSILLLAVLSLANLVFLLTLVRHSWQRSNWLALGAFVGNLVLSYTLVGLARMEQTAQLQWIEEFLNLANNSLLAVGAWSLIRRSASNE
jgi:peptidoglycan/LPS O-acetylase OafA/YrhL